MDLVKALNSQYMKEELPEVRVGDTVRVHVRIKEGSRERIQVFEGATASARLQRSRRRFNHPFHKKRGLGPLFLYAFGALFIN